MAARDNSHLRQRDERKIHARADGAAALLADPILQLAYDSIDHTLIDSIASTSPEDREREHELCQLLRVNRMHRATLQRWVDEGNALGKEQERRQPTPEGERMARKDLM